MYIYCIWITLIHGLISCFINWLIDSLIYIKLCDKCNSNKNIGILINVTGVFFNTHDTTFIWIYFDKRKSELSHVVFNFVSAIIPLCMFPFIYRGKIYDKCTSDYWKTPWCRTTTNSTAYCLREGSLSLSAYLASAYCILGTIQIGVI